MTPVFADRFRLLRDMGGEGTSIITLHLDSDQPGHSYTRYDMISIKVTLLIPFCHNGEAVESLVIGEDVTTTPRTIQDISELSRLLVDMRTVALGRALDAASKDIPEIMLKIRSSTSCSKRNKKVRSLFRRFNCWNFSLSSAY